MNIQDVIGKSSDSTEPTKSSHENKKESRSERSKKKSSWYNVLYPTYKSRSEDFKRIFKDVPDDERLVVGKCCFKSAAFYTYKNILYFISCQLFIKLTSLHLLYLYNRKTNTHSMILLI